ncbi:MAG: tetratricopeptide repeat protein [Cyanobacteria bacterium REEB67]|nr:tetratricopeptide repeat protein [Cyanobacteria bacterium REEB67]
MQNHISGTRRCVSLTICLLTVLLASIKLSVAQSDGWQKAMQNADAAIKENHFREAEDIYKNAIARVENSHLKDDQVLDCKKKLARVYFSEGKNTECEALWNEILTLSEKSHGKDSTANLESLYSLAQIYATRGAFEKATITIQKAKAIDDVLISSQPAISAERRTIALTVNNLGVIYLNKGLHSVAEEMFTEAIRLCPSYAIGYANRACSRRYLNNRSGNAEDVEQAKQLGFKFPTQGPPERTGSGQK